MVLITGFEDYLKQETFNARVTWARNNMSDNEGRPYKITGCNSHFIQWGDPRNDPIYRVGAWQIDFQYATKIVFENGVEMIFKGGKNPHNKVNDEGIDLVTFLNKYIENGYELPFNAVTDVEDILF